MWDDAVETTKTNVLWFFLWPRKFLLLEETEMKPLQDKKGFWTLVKNPTYLYMTKAERPHFDPHVRHILLHSSQSFREYFLEFSCHKIATLHPPRATKINGQDCHAVASLPECNSADVLWKLSVCTVGPVSHVIISSCNSPKTEWV